ncbi:MAG TPA: class I SAM-dependent methyltransferase [Vicinamibacterales bacterium]|nr:class I SAM-dependent methyltransferase [Vicinamibacterales bacterium]
MDGIVNFGVRDEFYEAHGFVSTGRNFGNSIRDHFGLYFARHQHLYEIARIVPAGAAVIEIGCGGGSKFLGSRFDMLGVEVSARSSQRAASAYASVIQATAERLPVRDGVADAIVSSCVLEHFADDVIESSMGEMARVLKPGGVMVHFLDLDNDGPFYRWAKRQPWHHAVFVTQKGHFGLRPLTTWRQLLNGHGFRPLRERMFNKSWLQDLTIWAALDDPLVHGTPRTLGRAALALIKHTGVASDIVINLVHNTVESWLPERWAAKAILVVEKVH